MKVHSILLSLLLLQSPALQAGNAFFAHVPVQSQIDAGGQGADACQFAGAVLVREQFAGQAATQVAGPDPADPTRIYTKAGEGSFVLSDVGNQFTTSVGQTQALLAFLETEPGVHGWTGVAYAGASRGVIQKVDVWAGKIDMPDALMVRLPSATLIQASPTAIQLQIPACSEPSGLAHGLRLWRRRADLPLDPWQSLQDLALLGVAQTLTDTAVSDGQAYTYGLSFIYDWLGGGGAGADPSAPEKYITTAKGLSATIFASLVQPTPTPFPTLAPSPVLLDLGQALWIAYPNPLMGTDLYLAFKTEKDKSQYQLTVYSLDGAKVMEFKGQADVKGIQKPAVPLTKLASGVYLARLRVLQPGQAEQVLPVRKLAIIR